MGDVGNGGNERRGGFLVGDKGKGMGMGMGDVGRRAERQAFLSHGGVLVDGMASKTVGCLAGRFDSIVVSRFGCHT